LLFALSFAGTLVGLMTDNNGQSTSVLVGVDLAGSSIKTVANLSASGMVLLNNNLLLFNGCALLAGVKQGKKNLQFGTYCTSSGVTWKLPAPNPPLAIDYAVDLHLDAPDGFIFIGGYPHGQTRPSYIFAAYNYADGSTQTIPPFLDYYPGVTAAFVAPKKTFIVGGFWFINDPTACGCMVYDALTGQTLLGSTQLDSSIGVRDVSYDDVKNDHAYLVADMGIVTTDIGVLQISYPKQNRIDYAFLINITVPRSIYVAGSFIFNQRTFVASWHNLLGNLLEAYDLDSKKKLASFKTPSPIRGLSSLK